MTHLQRLRNFVGARGDWNSFGTCNLAFGSEFLLCETNNPNVYVHIFPDLTDYCEKLSEARAQVILETLTKPKAVDLEKELIP